MKKHSNWLIPTLLIFAMLVPIAGGTVRILDIAKGNKITEENARFFTAPIIVILHIICSCFYGILGSFQFSKSFRTNHITWHKYSGSVLVILGLITSITGLYMTIVFPHVPTDGPTLYSIRILVGIFMTTSILFAIKAILNKKFKTHGEWMLRAYAIGLGASTQVLTHLPWFIFAGGIPTGLIRDFLMALGWILNAIFAEWIILNRKVESYELL